MSLTNDQQRAVDASGNVIVVAGAGTGKTKTLVERCVEQILKDENPVSVDQILVVTFTNAAAAEVRNRIRDRLENELIKNPSKTRVVEQIGILDRAHICTLHSFCYHLIRQHFYLLDLDPKSKLMDAMEAQLLRAEVLDDYIEQELRNETKDPKGLRRLILDYFDGDDRKFETFIENLHDYTQTREDAVHWFTSQLNHFQNPNATVWMDLLPTITEAWIRRWKDVGMNQPLGNPAASLLRKVFSKLQIGSDHYRDGLQLLSDCDKNKNIWVRGTVGKYKGPLRSMFDDAQLLLTFQPNPNQKGVDPLQEDWNDVRGYMVTLLNVAQGFSRVYNETKLKNGVLDFHDLEQFSIRLLWNAEQDKPTPVAENWREIFAHVFVDEYQDINPAQDKIITCLSALKSQAKRFMVGDVKQSIYGFRQANPTLFLDYEARWGKEPCDHECVYLKDNFRSHEGILAMVNGLFSTLMTPDSIGFSYKEKHQLNFGDPENRSRTRMQSQGTPPVEFLIWDANEEVLVDKNPDKSDEDKTEAPIEGHAREDVDAIEAEALLIARRFKRLIVEETQIFDEQTADIRKVEYRDMAILLRGANNRLDGFATVFHREGIPLKAHRAGFYESIEVMDLLHLLEILDNPLQDIPVIAVMRSPLVGLSLAELAQIKQCHREPCYWLAIKKMAKGDKENPLTNKLLQFLSRWQNWRALGRHLSIIQRLEMILSETNYLYWLRQQDRKDQRLGSVQHLLELAREFGRRQGGTLYHFVRFLKKRQELVGDEDPSKSSSENAVSIMSIHGSKGLEFPVVAVAGLGARFNETDQNQLIMVDDTLGICPTIKLSKSGQHYESLTLWQARKTAKNRCRQEEMRLLYVAMTRAREKLFLVGVANKSKREKWMETDRLSTEKILSASSYLDWIGPWVALQPLGNRPYLQSWVGSEEASSMGDIPCSQVHLKLADALHSSQRNNLKSTLQWIYPHSEATHQPAKTTVTSLRKSSLLLDPDGIQPLSESHTATRIAESFRPKVRVTLTPQKVGAIHHRFLELMQPHSDFSNEVLEGELQRLLSAKIMTHEETQCLDLPAIAAFWKTSLGMEILAHWPNVKRELAFTSRLKKGDLTNISIALPNLPEDDFTVLQGMADLVVLLPDELWIVDFKTDRGNPVELEEKARKYSIQLSLYAFALSQIYRRPANRIYLHFLHYNQTSAVTHL